MKDLSRRLPPCASVPALNHQVLSVLAATGPYLLSSPNLLYNRSMSTDVDDRPPIASAGTLSTRIAHTRRAGTIIYSDDDSNVVLPARNTKFQVYYVFLFR